AALPRMPVPPLRRTLDQLIDSLTPLYGQDSGQVREFKRQAAEFEKSIGYKLQRVLQLKSWWAPNYVTDWWEKYVYLMSRSPLPINSNYYILDHSYFKPTSNPAARAGYIVHHLLRVKRMLDREQIEPLLIRSTIPVCMSQYERAFSTTRVPGEDIDELVHYPSSKSKHIIVLSSGHYYKVDVYDSDGAVLSTRVLEDLFQWIVDDSKQHDSLLNSQSEPASPTTPPKSRPIMEKSTEQPIRTSSPAPSSKTRPLMERFAEQPIRTPSPTLPLKSRPLWSVSQSESRLAALTALERTKWAKIRRQHFLESEASANKDFLATLESAINVVSFCSDPVSDDFSERGKMGLHGNGRNIWFDKNANLIFHPSGRFAVHCEHSWADAPVFAHLIEFVYTAEAANPDKIYDSCGRCLPDPAAQKPIRQPERLVWRCSESLANEIDDAYQFSLKNNADLDLVVRDFNEYGKGVIKCFKVSPDAYVQMVLHLAYYRMHGKFALTYESSMTRLFLCGRTETVRSLTQSACDFVLAMCAKECDSGLRIRLLRRAADEHQTSYRNAMAGLGCDRHLFALYVIGRGLGYESEFLKSTLTLPWILSTSQQPQQQLADTPSCDLPEFRDCVSPGGGFGPVADQGYGVSYMLAGDFRIFFHVSSKRSAADTDSTRFMDHIYQALRDVKALFDGHSTAA
uniref:Carn_acyltransf domain-containing protein n=1 Tax=Macrostomum lignano TaxID=282301 RepID=A0A1I8HVA2_9PLAT